MKVIPHQKPTKGPRVYREPKPKRYWVEWFSYSEDRWIMKDDYRSAWNAKGWARYWEDTNPEVAWRVVDTRG